MNVLGKPIPTEWLDILAEVWQQFPECILAGGCLRDLYFGGPVKDLDIFVKYSGAELIRPSQDWALVHSVGANYCAAMRDSVRHLETWDVAGLEVNIIHLDIPDFTLYNVISRMDFGACQVGTDGVVVGTTFSAYCDLLDRKITLQDHITDPMHRERSLRRAERFRQKYAGTDVQVVV